MNRIPREADVLFEVEVRRIVNSGATVTFNEEEAPEENEHPFEKTYKFAEACMQAGNDMFKKVKLKEAIKQYNKAGDALERCLMRDSFDEEKQQQLLYKIYGNLLIVWVKLEEPRKACINFNKLNKLCIGSSLRLSAKAHFNHGKALMMFAEYKRARGQLLAARAIEPGNSEISRELKKLDGILQQNANRNKAMGLALIGGGGSKCDEEFRKYVQELCIDLKNDMTSKQYSLPDELPKGHVDLIKQICPRYGLVVKTFGTEKDPKYYISKIE